MQDAEPERTGALFVMCCALDNKQFSSVASLRCVLASKLVDETMLVVDSTAPVTIPVAERLRLADASVSIAFNVLDEQIDSLQNLFVLKLPARVLIPCAWREYGSGTSVTTSNGSLRRMTNWRRKRRTALDMSSPAFSKSDSASCRRRLSTRICSVDVAILQSFVVQNDCIVSETHLHVNEEE